ncbi:MAG: DinB family protein [Edaphobacter sp.]
MVRYTKEQDGAEFDPAELSERLATVLREAMPWLLTVSEAEASVPERAGKWSGKEVIGHLIDSAVNNLGRIVRMQIEEGQRLPGYEQMEWVSLQHYAEREWSQVLALWFALNEHVAWTVEHVEAARLASRSMVGGEEVTLGFLIADYVAHMEHHLLAMRLWLGIESGVQGQQPN